MSNYSISSGPRAPRPQSSALSTLSQSRPTLSSSLAPLRPHSSASVRPTSRLSQRPQSRHAKANQNRLLPLCEQLVSQFLPRSDTGEDEEKRDKEDEQRRKLVDMVLERVESTTLNKAGASLGIKSAGTIISGHAQKARINSRDALADAMETCYRQLKAHLSKNSDLDQDFTIAHLPDHIQLLLALSQAPTTSTVAYASIYLENLTNPPAPPQALTWAEILRDDPYEGQHWQGVHGLPSGSVKGIRSPEDEDDYLDDSPSLSPLDSDDMDLDSTDDDETFPVSPEPRQSFLEAPIVEPALTRPLHAYAHRKDMEDLQKRQYWRPEWKMTERLGVRFDIGDASVLGPTLQKVLGRGPQNGLPAEILQLSDRYIYERDAVREILMALQGRSNMLLDWQELGFTVSKNTPKLLHLSLLSQYSIVSAFAKTATTLQKLRQFTKAIISPPPSSRISVTRRATRTLEAFADAVREEVQALNVWCADRERQSCEALAGSAPTSQSSIESSNPNEGKLVISLLSTEKAVRDSFSEAFQVLWDIISKVIGTSPSGSNEWTLPNSRLPPSISIAHLLDTLFLSVQEHLERGDGVVADTIMRVFVKTAQPVWTMIGRWLKDGMAVGIGFDARASEQLDDEFFIECNGLGTGVMGMGLLDPDFWAEGFTLRDGVREEEEGMDRRRGIPAFLLHVAEPVLSSGKAVGLLEVLDVTSEVQLKWRSFSELISVASQPVTTAADSQSGLFSVSVDTLSSLIYEELTPYCLATGARLAEVVAQDCDLFQHLQTTENLYFMGRGDVMSQFSDLLFAKMDGQQNWADFHFLNSAFNDTVEANSNAGAKDWIHLPLVRLSYRSQEHHKNISRTVRAIEGLLVEYAVPFPLTYIFSPKAMQVYGEVLVFLLQIRRAKSVLERILVRGDSRKMGNELKVFYALRGRLKWFIDMFLTFVTTYVIHAQVLKFHKELAGAKSLDEMIRLHDEHLDKIQGRCLLQEATSSLHRAILTILDLCFHFGDIFAGFGSDTAPTLDLSRASVSRRRHHHSRRQRRQRKNVIGFFDAPAGEDSSSEDDSEVDEAVSLSMAATTISTADEGVLERIDKMSAELDGLVRFIRRGTESLAGGGADAAATFGILAFALEDWDL
ncbi:Spc98 family-domain-containing protein [Mycena floridula]|nr:Spc98 family-domain-containing protein [Mycena floridula]